MSGRINELMSAGWSVTGPTMVDEGGEVHWEIRVPELPDFFVAGATREEALDEFLPAFRAFIECVVDGGDVMPRPAQPRWRTQSPLGVGAMAILPSRARVELPAPVARSEVRLAGNMTTCST